MGADARIGVGESIRSCLCLVLWATPTASLRMDIDMSHDSSGTPQPHCERPKKLREVGDSIMVTLRTTCGNQGNPRRSHPCLFGIHPCEWKNAGSPGIVVAVSGLVPGGRVLCWGLRPSSSYNRWGNSGCVYVAVGMCCKAVPISLTNLAFLRDHDDVLPGGRVSRKLDSVLWYLSSASAVNIIVIYLLFF